MIIMMILSRVWESEITTKERYTQAMSERVALKTRRSTRGKGCACEREERRERKKERERERQRRA